MGNRQYKPNNNHFKNAFLGVGLTTFSLMSASVGAEPRFVDADPSPLESIEGLNVNQQSIARGIHNACANFLSLTNSGANSENLENDLQRDLFARCGNMVHTGNQILGDGPTALDLGLDADQYGSALNAIANDETSGQTSSVSETANGQLANITSRLQALRAAARGLSVAGINLQLDGERFDGEQLASIADGRGGAAGSAASALSFFINGIVATGDKDGSDLEVGFDYDSSAVTAGIDYRFSDSLVAGVAIGFNEAEIDIDNNAGELDNEGTSFTVYGSYFLQDWYVDFALTQVEADYDSERSVVLQSTDTALGSVVDIQRVTTGDTEGDQTAFSLGVGYSTTHAQLTIDYSLRLNSIDATIDGYDERSTSVNGTDDVADSLSLRLEDQDVESFQAILGVQAYYAISQDFGVITPHARISLHNELEDDEFESVASYVHDPESFLFTVSTDEQDSSYGVVGIGLAAVLKGGMQFFIDYEMVVGLEDVSNQILTFGGRWEF